MKGYKMSENLIYILNGPNLNLLGSREPETYGFTTLKDIEVSCKKQANKLKYQTHFLQSNHEGQLIDWVQEARGRAVAIIINPAGYSHTSIALLDALKSFDGLVAEVHISNIHKRDAFRHHSYVSLRADCVIAGCGAIGYNLAMEFIADKLKVT